MPVIILIYVLIYVIFGINAQTCVLNLLPLRELI